MSRALLLFVALLLVSCATKSPQTNLLLKSVHDLPLKHQIADVPFTPQENFSCAPASLRMLLNYLGKDRSLAELEREMITPKSQGTFQTDLIKTARQENTLAVEISGIESLLREISQNHPVIVFQNVGLSLSPNWHYAVATGYDLKKRVITLHSGTDEHKKMYLKLFEETWSQGAYWGLVVLKPSEVPASATEAKYLEGAVALEALQLPSSAELSYENILKKWPQNLVARIGLGNIYFSQKKYRSSVAMLEAAVKDHPESSVAKNNLAVARDQLKGK